RERKNEQETPVFVKRDETPHLFGSPIHRDKIETKVLEYKRRHSDRFAIDIHSIYDGILAIHENYSPYWRAEIDGRPVEVFRANHAFMGVHVTAGNHRIRFVYVPYPFYIGCAIGGAALIGFMVIFYISPKPQWS
ncbi:YfhO family protein, partial [bacterium]|nr:YfhO family protein [bacterium]